MIPFIWNVHNKQIHRERKQISGWQGLREKNRDSGGVGVGEVCDC